MIILILLMQDEFCKTCWWPWWRKNHLEEIQFQSEEASQRPSWSTIPTRAWRVSKAGGKFLCEPTSRMYMRNNTAKVETNPRKFCATSSQCEGLAAWMVVPRVCCHLSGHILVEWQSWGAVRQENIRLLVSKSPRGVKLIQWSCQKCSLT